MKKLNVWGVTTVIQKDDRDKMPVDQPWRRQARYIAAVSSAKEFASLLNTSIGYINNYASITGNEDEIKVALANPHKLIFRGTT